MNLRVLLALVLAAAALLVGLVLVLSDPAVDPGPQVEGDPGETDVQRDEALVDPGTDSPADPPSRTEVPGGATDGSGRDDAPLGDLPGTTTVTVHGRVLDPTGAPLAGVPIVSDDAPRRALAESNGAGRFSASLAVVGRSATLQAMAGRYATVRGCVVEARTADREQILVAAPAIDLGGRVVDEAGQGLAGARVSVGLTSDLLRAFPLPLDRSTRTSYSMETDEAGGFRLERVPAVPGAMLRAALTGYACEPVPEPNVSRLDFVLEMRADSGRALEVEGVVRLPDGTPAAGAAVRYGYERDTTDEAGHFALPLQADLEESLPLAAGLEGYGPAVVPRFGALLAEHAPLPPPPLVLYLAANPLELSGRVVDEAGVGQPGWRVYIPVATTLSSGELPPSTAETLGGGELASRTGEDGSFRITGLGNRDYALRAYHLDTLQVIESEPLPAGTTDIVLTARAHDLYPLVHGTVQAHDGTPVPAVRVRLSLVLHQEEVGNLSIGGAEVVTAADGSFTMEDVPRAHAHLSADGMDIMPRSLDMADVSDPAQVLLVVVRRLHFRLVTAAATKEDVSFELLDAADGPLPLYLFEANGWSSRSRIHLVDGNTPVHGVSEDAVALRALAEDGREIRRQAIFLTPGQVTDIRVDIP